MLTITPSDESLEQSASDTKAYQFDFNEIFAEYVVSSYEVVVTGATKLSDALASKIVTAVITGGKPNTTCCIAVRAEATNSPTLSHTVYVYVKLV